MIALVSGGARSGKSSYAEERITAIPNPERIYIATMEPGRDPELLVRVERHREQRAAKGFRTIECQTGLEKLDVPKGSVVLLECLSNLLANEMFGEGGAAEEVVPRILSGVKKICDLAADVFIISNDIDSDGRSYDATVEAYRENLALLGRAIATDADEVIEVCAGIPVFWKGTAPVRKAL